VFKIRPLKERIQGGGRKDSILSTCSTWEEPIIPRKFRSWSKTGNWSEKYSKKNPKSNGPGSNETERRKASKYPISPFTRRQIQALESLPESRKRNMSASPPRGRSATNAHLRRGLARSISPRRRVMTENSPSPTYHFSSSPSRPRTPSPYKSSLSQSRQSSPLSQTTPPRRTRSLTRRSASAQMRKQELYNSQLTKLQEYRPRSFFIAVTVHARPLGLKLHSLDGRYLEVLSTDPNGHGARNGLRKGDLIVQINDDCFGNAPEGLEMLLNCPLPLEIHVRRLNAGMAEDTPAATPETSHKSSQENKSSQDGQATLSGSSTSRSDRSHIRRNSLERRKPH